MGYLNQFDYILIGIYFSILVGLSIFLSKRASASMEDYFLAGRKLPWWALGISGMATQLDIAGTMIIVSFLFLLGPRGLFIEFRGGAVLILAFCLVWMGKWHRRSGCMTGAEWMVYRFGDGRGGRMAQLLQAISSIVWCIGALGYLVIAVGLFLSTFIPFPPFACAVVMLGIATVYTMISGFYGVVFTDMFQSVIILVAVVFISVLAINKVIDIGGSEGVAALAAEVTNNSQWISGVPHWKTSMPEGYKQYEYLAMFMLFYLLRMVFGGLGQCGWDQRYFGARSDRECGLLTFLWTWLMMLRWPLMIGFAVLGLFIVKDMFPDQTFLADAAVLIKQNVEVPNKEGWSTAIANIANRPQDFSLEFVTELKALLGGGAQWGQRLQMLSFEGTVNPEKILPSVLLFCIPQGFRGLMLIALIAASMSTFDSTVNMTTAMFTRDIYQKHIRRNASTKELIYASWAFILALVTCGFLFAYTIRSVNDIWEWIIMGLMGGALVPIVLRFYWWRFNGYGFTIGTFVGMVGAITQRIVYPDMDGRWMLLYMVLVGLVGSLAGTYLTKPMDRKVVENFYRTTRPFGFWKPFRDALSDEEYKSMRQEHFNDIVALPFTLLWQITLFLAPMLLIIGSFKAFGYTMVLFCIGLVGMYIFWYKKLPPDNVQSISDNVQ